MALIADARPTLLFAGTMFPRLRVLQSRYVQILVYIFDRQVFDDDRVGNCVDSFLACSV